MRAFVRFRKGIRKNSLMMVLCLLLNGGWATGTPLENGVDNYYQQDQSHNRQSQSLDEIILSIYLRSDLELVFAEIQEKTEFFFTYRSKTLRDRKLKDSVMTDISLGDLLRFMSANAKLAFKRIDENIYVFPLVNTGSSSLTEVFNEHGQEITISGVVTSKQDNEGLLGVNVILKGSNMGTNTDANGKFTLTAPGDASLVFSYVGFGTREIDINNRTRIDVVFEEDASQLNEVIISGYVPINKKEITGAMSTVAGMEFEYLPVQSFDKALQGRASGVQINSATGQPGGAVDFKIRGVGSVNASNSPLVIIDGVQMAIGELQSFASSNVLGIVNPNDIASIEVLKDASATAIYGAQGANGVVLVTTKSGKADGGRLTFTLQEGVVQPIGLYDMLTAPEMAQLRHEAMVNAGKDPATGYDVFGDPADPTLETTDWRNEVFRTGRSSLYGLSYSGGDEKNQYYLSGSYNKQEGHIISTDWERYTFQLNMNAKPIPNLTIAPKLLFGVQEINGTFDGQFVSTNAAYLAQTALPSIPIYNAAGEYTNYGSVSFTGQPNPVQSAKEVQKNVESMQTISSLSLNYEILPSFRAIGFAGINVDKPKSIVLFPGTMPLFRAIGGQKSRTDGFTVNFNTYATLSYKIGIGEGHQFNFLTGSEYKSLRSEMHLTNVHGFPDPSFILIGSASTVNGVTESITRSVRVGYFGKLAYNYKHKYLIDITIRRDGSSRFSPRKRFGTFYAGALSWAISQEGFLQNSFLIDFLKLRASYGLTGNSEIGDFRYLQVYNSASITNYYQGQRSIVLNRPEGLPFGWEESLQVNIGVDYGIISSKVTGSVDIWRKDNRDVLFEKRLPLDAGFQSVLTNAGKVRNQGVDFELSSVNIASGDFRWDTQFNITFQENELIELPDGAERLGNELIVGQPLDFVYGAEYAGVDPQNGRPMWYDVNGELTYLVREEDQKVIGDLFPDYFGGLTNTLKYKNISLEIFFQFQGGLVTYNTELSRIEVSGSSPYFNQRKTQLDRWQKPGDITDVPRPYDGGTEPGGSYMNILSTKLLSDGSYIKLMQAQLGYDLPAAFLNKVGIREANVYLQGYNLYVFTKSQSLDPEVVAGASPSGNVFMVFPSGQQYTAGVTLTF